MYDDRCEVLNLESGKVVEAEILDFKSKNICVVSLERSIKLTLKYNPQQNNYVCKKIGLEFTTNGPKEI